MTYLKGHGYRAYEGKNRKGMREASMDAKAKACDFHHGESHMLWPLINGQYERRMGCVEFVAGIPIPRRVTRPSHFRQMLPIHC